MTIASRFSPYKVQIFEPVPLAGDRGIRLPKSAEIRFFQPGDTFTPKDVYSTEADAIAGANSLGNTVKANALGQLPEVWFTDAVRAIAYIENANGQMVDLPGWDIDNLGSGGDLVIRLWDSVTTFSENDYAVGPDFNLYVSKVSSNLNNDPVGDYTNWRPSGSWVSRVSGYSSGEWAWHNGKWWYSTANTNTNAPGGANWLSPADNLFNALTIPATDSFIQIDASASTAEYSQLFKPDKDNDRVILASSSSPGLGSSQNVKQSLQQADGTEIATVGFDSSANLQITNKNHGGNIVISGESTAGTARTFFTLDPDAQVITAGQTFNSESNTTVTSMSNSEFITLANGEKITLANLVRLMSTYYTDNDLAFYAGGAVYYNNTGVDVYVTEKISGTLNLYNGDNRGAGSAASIVSLSGSGSNFGALNNSLGALSVDRSYPTPIYNGKVLIPNGWSCTGGFIGHKAS